MASSTSLANEKNPSKRKSSEPPEQQQQGNDQNQETTPPSHHTTTSMDPLSPISVTSSVSSSPQQLLYHPYLRSSFLIADSKPGTCGNALQSSLGKLHFHAQYQNDTLNLRDFILFLKRATIQRDELVLVYLNEGVSLESVQRVSQELWDFCCSMQQLDDGMNSTQEGDKSAPEGEETVTTEAKKSAKRRRAPLSRSSSSSSGWTSPASPSSTSPRSWKRHSSPSSPFASHLSKLKRSNSSPLTQSSIPLLMSAETPTSPTSFDPMLQNDSTFSFCTPPATDADLPSPHRFVLLCVEVNSVKRQKWLRNEYLYSKNSSSKDNYGMFVCGFKQMNHETIQQFLTATILPGQPIDQSLRELDHVIWRTTLLRNRISNVILVSERAQEEELRDFFNWIMERKSQLRERKQLRSDAKLVVPLEEIVLWRLAYHSGEKQRKDELGSGAFRNQTDDSSSLQNDTNPPQQEQDHLSEPSSPSENLRILPVDSSHLPEVSSPLTSPQYQEKAQSSPIVTFTGKQNDFSTPSPHETSTQITSKKDTSISSQFSPPQKKHLWEYHTAPSHPDRDSDYVAQLHASSPLPSVWKNHKFKTEIKNKLMYASRITCISLYTKIGSCADDLTSELLCDTELKNYFTGGIYWVHCGSAIRPINILFQLHHLCSQIDESEVAHIHSIVNANLILSRLLQDKKALIILDNVHTYEQLDAFLLHNVPTVKYLVTTTIENIIKEYPKTREHEAAEYFVGDLTRTESINVLASVIEPNQQSQANSSNSNASSRNDLSSLLPNHVLELVDWCQGEYTATVLLSKLFMHSNHVDGKAIRDGTVDMSAFDDDNTEHLIYWKTFTLLQYVLHTHLLEISEELQLMAALPQDTDIALSVLQFLWEDSSLQATKEKVEILHRYGIIEVSTEDEQTWIRLPQLIAYWLHVITSNDLHRFHQRILQRFASYCPQEKQRDPNASVSPKTPHSPVWNSNTKSRASRRSSLSSHDDDISEDPFSTPASTTSEHTFPLKHSPLHIPRIDIASARISEENTSSHLTPRSAREMRFEYGRGSPRSSRNKPHTKQWKLVTLWHYIDLSEFASQIYLNDYYFRFLFHHLHFVGRFECIKRTLFSYEWIFRKVRAVKEFGEILLDFEHVRPNSDAASDPSQTLSSFPKFANIYQALKDSLPVLQLSPHQLPFQLIGRLIHLRGRTRTFLHQVLSFHKALNESWMYPFVPFQTGCFPSGRMAKNQVMNLFGAGVRDAEKFSITPDSSQVAFMGGNGHLNFFNISSGECESDLAAQADWNFDFTPCGRFVISAAYDRTLRKIDRKTGVQVMSFVQENDLKSISFFKVSPDGRFVFAGSQRRLVIWSVKKGTLYRITDFDDRSSGRKNSLTAVIWDCSTRVPHIFVARDGLITRIKASTGSEVRRYDIQSEQMNQTGESVPHSKNSDYLSVNAMSSNCKFLFSVFSHTHAVSQHNIQTGKCVRMISCERPLSVALAGQILVVGTESGSVEMKNLNTGISLGSAMAYPEIGSARVAVTPDEQFIIAAVSSLKKKTHVAPSVKLFDVRHLINEPDERIIDVQEARYNEEHAKNAIGSLFVQGNIVIPVSEGGRLIPHKLDSGRQLDVWNVSPGRKAISPDLSFIAVAAEQPHDSNSSLIELWDLAEDFDAPKQELYIEGEVSQIFISYYNDVIVLQKSTNKVLIMDHKDGLVKHEFCPENDAIDGVFLNNENTSLVLSLASSQLRIYSLSSPYTLVCELYPNLEASSTINDVFLFENEQLYVAHGSCVDCWTLQNEEQFAASGFTSVDSRNERGDDQPAAAPQLASRSSSSRSSSEECLEEMFFSKLSACHMYTYHDSEFSNHEITSIFVSVQDEVMVTITNDDAVCIWHLDKESEIVQLAHLDETPLCAHCELPFIAIGDIVGKVNFIKYFKGKEQLEEG